MKQLHGLWLTAALAACADDTLPAATADAGRPEAPNCASAECPAVDLRDRACSDATRCPPGEGCGAAGRCGVCARDAECRRGERCAAGACLPTRCPRGRSTSTRSTSKG